MRCINFSRRSQKDIIRMSRRGKSRAKLEAVLDILAHRGKLPGSYRPHALVGNYQGFWECHIEHDWLLIYEVLPTSIEVIRTGSHADLFNI